MKGERSVGGMDDGDKALVERRADEPCCQSCLAEQDEGYGSYSDYCCCIHGTLYGYRWAMNDGRVSWATDESEAEWEAAP